VFSVLRRNFEASELHSSRQKKLGSIKGSDSSKSLQNTKNSPKNNSRTTWLRLNITSAGSLL